MTNVEKAIEAVRKIVFEPRGIKEIAEPEVLEQEDDDGNLWENIVHYISQEDHRKLVEEEIALSDLTDDLPKVRGYDCGYAPYFELDRGINVLDKPAVCFYSNFLESAEEDEY